MFKIFLTFVLLSCIAIVYADSATQTDWSGGPGFPGPVVSWTDTFDGTENLSWTFQSGQLILSFRVLATLIESSVDYSPCVTTADFDGDGDEDVAASESVSDWIRWYENTGNGSSWITHTVSEDEAQFLKAADIDLDGDSDLVAYLLPSGSLVWYENQGPDNWIYHLVCLVEGAPELCVSDMDSDGDMDILSGCMPSSGEGSLSWWENTDGAGGSWKEQTLYISILYPLSVDVADFDGDGDVDAVCSRRWETKREIGWIEHDFASDTHIWTYHLVAELPGYLPHTVRFADLTGDGSPEIVASIYSPSSTGGLWYYRFNEDVWEVFTIWNYSSYTEIPDLAIGDPDSDGDLDVLGSDDSAWIAWWENTDASGTQWEEHVVSDTTGAECVATFDADGDGYLDLVTSYHSVLWWDLIAFENMGNLESSILDTQDEPSWGFINWSCDEPMGTEITFRVRGSDDPNNMGFWSLGITAPVDLSDYLADGVEYVQYRVEFETSQPALTPSLYDVTLNWDPLGIEGENPAIFGLLPFSPNPSTTPIVRFGLPEPASVDISIFDLSGRLVSKVQGDEYSAGYHDVLLGDISPGVYFCRVISGDFAAAQRFVVIE